MMMAREDGLWSCDVELDAHMVVKLVSSPIVSCSEVDLVIQDIKLQLLDFLDCKISFVPRKVNMAAHCLAKLGLTIENDNFLVGGVPY
ncbi:hypothetical protein Dsin_019891 [Dipteronia sinensis]|uniref:RNase H type-1 domain-containing protein n=1 Tax=Dipteronia sinensis TaxID=43782 RepID=A0AAE0A868_9ROSI|nr:hypothetical protein Dsin_019380 [Dipteronia sinensis]KAK3205845.1 hypothetical protein Dsin_019891 [Dipteronia sinensis]